MTESRTQGLFAELLEGARALEERPALEAKIADAQAAEARANAAAKFAEERYNTLATDYDAIKAKLAQMEADLAQATFREKEAGDKLAVLVGAFKTVSREINESVELVAPEPKPEPAPTPAVDTSTTFTTDGEPSTDLPGKFPWFDAAVPNDYNPPTPTTEVAVTPPGPFGKSSMEGSELQQSAPPTTTGTASNGGTSIPLDLKPHADKPYWLKPDSMAWRDWTDGGGDRAPWIKDADLDSHW